MSYSWEQRLAAANPDEAAFIHSLLGTQSAIWEPLPGPQSDAYASEADIIGYGGAAGGGKTDLACGKAVTQHKKVMVFRRNGTELSAVLDRFTELLGSRDGYNGKDNIWRVPAVGVQMEFAGIPFAGDEKKFRGRPHDLLVFDEASEFLESQIRFLLAWLRTVDPTQRCQALLTFNPPTSAEGMWIIKFFAPWLDRRYTGKRALPGELRYFASIAGKDVEVADKRAFVMKDGKRNYDFDPKEYTGKKAAEIIRPMSRTFIPSRVTDNPYLIGTNYMATLQALPEPLRSQMLNGDFEAGMKDDAMQVIPTAWVERAMARWKKPDILPPMDSIGVDVARGGDDNTVIARRHGMFFDTLLTYPGTETPNGPTIAGLVISAARDNTPQHIDVIGVGASPYDFLVSARQPAYGINVSEKATGLDKSGRLRFFNQRSELWWRMREALDPEANNGVMLPDDAQLKADLCAPKWEMRGPIVKVESRDEIIDRIGRSPDWASAVILALIETPKVQNLPGVHGSSKKPYNPYDNI